MDFYSFYTGKNFDVYQYLGAHREGGGWIFRVFAPNAARVTLLGDFTEGYEYEMNRIGDGNFFEVWTDRAKAGDKYFHRIYSRSGGYTDHCDIYGYGMDLRPEWRSVLCDLSEYSFGDEKWMNTRTDFKNKPLNIYELHAGSWKRHEDGSWLSYTELADELVGYLKKTGYNCVEFLPLSEHPCDESWGYQNTGFFAPTSRYGTAAELMKLIDKLHRNDIAAVMDFVPVHFAVDNYGIGKYDGTALYEYPNTDVGVSEWGSCNFMHSRGEVRSFLQSCACYWLKEFHFDGIRMDAISRIIYWQGEERRGVNGNGVDFIRTMNRGLKERMPTCMLFAEDSTNFPGVTKSVDQGGLGYDYKWDMGFMNDTLNYFRTAPEYRSENYHKLTFSMMYYYNENYILPFSHDENVHGKATIIQKMNGEYDEKFPQARALYLYMYIHPGKKLNFMGSEFAQFREWDESRAQDWEILKYPKHDSFRCFMTELNKIYISNPAFFEQDYVNSGFQWIDCDNVENCIYAIERQGGGRTLAAVFNFGDSKKDYSVTKYQGRTAKLLLNTDWNRFGGDTHDDAPCDITALKLPPFSGVLVEIK